MMGLEKRVKRTNLRNELCKLLTECSTDNEYYQRLIWAQQYIAECLEDFVEDSELE